MSSSSERKRSTTSDLQKLATPPQALGQQRQTQQFRPDSKYGLSIETVEEEEDDCIVMWPGDPKPADDEEEEDDCIVMWPGDVKPVKEEEEEDDCIVMWPGDPPPPPQQQQQEEPIVAPPSPVYGLTETRDKQRAPRGTRIREEELKELERSVTQAEIDAIISRLGGLALQMAPVQQKIVTTTTQSEVIPHGDIMKTNVCDQPITGHKLVELDPGFIQSRLLIQYFPPPLWREYVASIDEVDDNVFWAYPELVYPCGNGPKCVALSRLILSEYSEADGSTPFKGVILPAYYLDAEDAKKSEGRLCVLCMRKVCTQMTIVLAMCRLTGSSTFTRFCQPWLDIPTRYCEGVCMNASSCYINGLRGPFVMYEPSKLEFKWDGRGAGCWYVDQSALLSDEPWVPKVVPEGPPNEKKKKKTKRPWE